jgi:hypothetical protein
MRPVAPCVTGSGTGNQANPAHIGGARQSDDVERRPTALAGGLARAVPTPCSRHTVDVDWHRTNAAQSPHAVRGRTMGIMTERTPAQPNFTDRLIVLPGAAVLGSEVCVHGTYPVVDRI